MSQFLAIKGENTCLMMQKQNQNHRNTATEKRLDEAILFENLKVGRIRSLAEVLTSVRMAF